MDTHYEKLISFLDRRLVKLNEPLSKHTTVRIGGPADIWYEAISTDKFVEAIKKARELGIPVTVLGRGSNVLIGDKGIRGLVIKNAEQKIEIIEEPISYSNKDEKDVKPRWSSDSTLGTFKYEFKDLDYSEEAYPRIFVDLDSGVDMPYALNFLLEKGITGLQWFSRIPGTLGGWIYNNVHGGTHFFSEVIENVTVLTNELEIKTLTKDQLNFDYDMSIFHQTQDIILKATLRLYKGDKQKARYVAIEWAKRKSVQPSNSIGSVFKNISDEDKQRLNLPTNSIGYIVEHVLKMSGFQIGDAAISRSHHGFIENKGEATASDYLKVIKAIQKKAKKELNLNLETEIFLLGEF